MTDAGVITVSTPAKINLGLEILGRRNDGYHEIRTVMAAVNLEDTIRIAPDPESSEIRISGVAGVRPQDNLIVRAVEAFSRQTGIRSGLSVDVVKRIPSPGGMGGASSNAAGTLLAIDAMFGTSLPLPCLREMAAQLGSDVPFFLGTPAAIASGTGTDLQPLPPLEAAVVLVVPPVSLQAKTATLYASLRPGDFTDGSSVDSVGTAIERGEMPVPGTLVNAFARPLYDMSPPLRAIANVIRDAGAPYVALTGAGPGHYVLLKTIEDASALADSIRTRVDNDVLVTAASLLTSRSMPVSLAR